MAGKIFKQNRKTLLSYFDRGSDTKTCSLKLKTVGWLNKCKMKRKYNCILMRYKLRQQGHETFSPLVSFVNLSHLIL